MMLAVVVVMLVLQKLKSFNLFSLTDFTDLSDLIWEKSALLKGFAIYGLIRKGSVFIRITRRISA